VEDSRETAKYDERLQDLELEQESWIPHWKEIRDNEIPYRGLFKGERPNDGTKRHDDLVDPTSLRGLKVLGAGMVGGLTNPSRPWFRFKLQDDSLNKRAAVKEWISFCEKKIYGIYSQSNFYSSIQSVYEEEGAFGTAPLVQLQHWDRIVHFMPLTCGSYMIGCDEFGSVDTLYRRIWMTSRNIAKKFKEGNLPESIKTSADKSPMDWIEVFHAIQPNDKRRVDSIDSKEMPFESVYWIAGEEKLLSKSGFQEFNAPTPRWDLTNGVYGWSPGMDVLASQKMAHEMDLGSLEAQQKELDPPIFRPSGFKNRLRTTPGAQNEVDLKNKEKIGKLYDFKFDVAGTIQLLDRKDRQILQLLYYDMFLMMANEAGREKTATEVVQLHEEKLIMLGPVIDRQFHELLDPTIERTFFECLRRGLFPPPPEELSDADMKIEYISMLAQAQQMVGTKAVNAYTGFVAGLAKMQLEAGQEPSALDRLDIDAAADEYADMTGVAPSIVVPVDKANAVRKARSEARQQAMQQQQQMQDAEMAKQLSQASTEGQNALTELQGTVRGGA
jgi:hypothetical protein